jgi:L-lactate dehydrogenase complex protein LldG
MFRAGSQGIGRNHAGSFRKKQGESSRRTERRMNTNRDSMLRRIREAVTAGNRAGGSPPLPERGNVGYQGAGSDPMVRFQEEFTRAGGVVHRVADGVEAVYAVVEFVRSRSIHRVWLGRGPVLDGLNLAEALREIGAEVVLADSPESENRETRFAAEVGISGVEYLIAETGSIVAASRRDEPRSLSLLPPLHIAVAHRRQLTPDLFDLFTLLGGKLQDLPAGLTLITGPSKTGDIELRLVTGVHGPGEVHVVLIDTREDASLS